MTSLREQGVPAPADTVTARRVARYAGFRPEVQGLRFVAVLLVVLYHVFLDRVSGGVDIFLLISAFFLTLSFVRKLEAGQPLALGRYWLHVFKRLLPLAVLTVLGTLVLAWLFYPEARIDRIRTEALASVFYVENWALARAEVDYYAADDSTASPFQHFWSLSVQGQVFLLWPLVFAAAWLLGRWRGWRPVPVLAVLFGAVFVVSLAWSVHSTAAQQAFAYFDTRARLWEFALGSLLALAVPYLRPPRAARVALGWAGMLSMVSVGVLIDVQGAFPGWIALWPLLSAAAIIVAGRSGSPFGLDRVLASKPLVRLGDASYALYLVHWPLLITYLVLRDRPVAGPRSGVVIILVSLVLAVLATALVERPFQRWAWPERTKRRLAVSVAVSLALVAVPVLAWQQADARRAALLAEEAARNSPGAAVLQPGFEFRGDPEAPTLPLASALQEEWVGLPEPCSGRFAPEQELLEQHCRQTPALPDPERTVLVVGNSHMEQFMGAVIPLAEERGWQLVAVLQPGCAFAVRPEGDACHEGNEAALDYVERLDPDMVLTTSTYAARMDGSAEAMVGGFPELVDRLTGQGIEVVGFRDNPRFDFNPYECAQTHGEDAARCQVPVAQVLAPVNPADALRDRPGFTSLDLTDLICPEGLCRPVVGNAFVFFDPHHLTWTYARTMAPALEERLLGAAGSGAVS
ncbi:acyltransferase family protein [Kocuria turfanensis]|uniref:Acyltransferase n=1 Tax=Kocuria turfanensis TaxID=388357 RepID=A0A512I848_9MICC|nr:acyltransferase family protein [Kocuria turfanensis]GEO93878.1 acyltransferase [Kocuria turfanensis]